MNTITQPLMQVYCAWCKKWMKSQKCDAKFAGEVSHGICFKCSKRMLDGLREKK